MYLIISAISTVLLIGAIIGTILGFIIKIFDPTFNFTPTIGIILTIFFSLVTFFSYKKDKKDEKA